MAREQLKTLTEPMYYILLSLVRQQHGYGIMRSVEELTEGRVVVGAGTMYTLLSRFENEQIIEQVCEVNRRKIYRLTAKGREVLVAEFLRLNRLVSDGKKFLADDGTILPDGENGGGFDGMETEISEEQSAEGSVVTAKRMGAVKEASDKKASENGFRRVKKGILIPT